MKKYFIILFILCFAVFTKSGFAQVVNGITYQAVAIEDRETPGIDQEGTIKNQTIDVRFTIIKETPAGAIVYQELHSTTTDNYGLFSVVIGQGLVTSTSPNTSILNLSWGLYKHFLKIEMDLKREGSFKTMGIEQMQAVPVALYALNAGAAGTPGTPGATGTIGVTGGTGTAGTTGGTGIT
ncbi:MAG: hypothetical protein K8R85_16640, partial [Bacteroidetes bacterium]|nr:hypothetical protein [Bacteroidota bacterium]